MKNWSLSRKIWSVLGLLAFAFVASTFFSLRGLSEVRDSLVDITEKGIKRDQLTSEILLNQRMISILTLESISLTDQSALKENEAKYQDVLTKQNEVMAEYESLASATGKGILAQYHEQYDVFIKQVTETRAHALKNEDEKAEAIYLSLGPTITKMREHVSALNKLTADQLKEKSASANATANNAILMGSLVASLSISVAMIIAFFVLRAITGTINNVVKSLSDSSIQVSSAATQIASSSEELSQATTEQAASLEETASAIEEMNAMVRKNSDSASSASTSSGQSHQKATHGRSVVEKMIQSMNAINESNGHIMEQINRSNENMAGIVKVIEEIGSKTKVINDIVFQTKLLSFNASVEAARAGEHGKGFAVVAEEVGTLAQMSGNAAKEISTMLDESIHRVNKIVQETKSTVEKLVADGKETVSEGSRVAHECGGVLDEIVTNVSSVSAMAGEIASASLEQSRGVNEITKAVGQLDQVTQQNAAVSQECASSAEELSAQAGALQNAVAQLVVAVNGGSSADGGASTPSHAESRPSLKKAAPKAQTAKVTPIRTETRMAAPKAGEAVMLKQASGDVPDYNNPGFEDL